MTIDFACSSCGRTLRVPEEYQGRKVKCPGCGNIQAAIAAAIQSDVANPSHVPAPQAFSSSSSAAVNPFEAPRTSETAASVGGGAIGNRVPEIGEIFSYAFGVWKEHLLMLIVATLVVFGISFGVGMAQNIVLAIVSSALDSQEAVIGVNFLLTALAQLVQIFVGIGLVRFNLQLLRGGKPDLGLLFSGADRFLPVVGYSIIAGIGVAIGLMLLIIPGLILLFMFWPSYYLVVDRATPVFESFGKSREISRGNVLNVLILVILGFGIMILGFLALCVGVLAAAPLVGLLWCTAYLMMSGQIQPRGAMQETTYA